MRYKQIKTLTEQTLFEVNMSPGGLRKLASQINAKAGMEFEMIVPNVKIDGEEDFESEPDYEHDPRTRSISDIREFFHDGDHNGRRAVDDLVEELEQEFYEWRQTKIDEEWASDGHEFFAHWVRENVSDDEWLTGDDEDDENEAFSKYIDREWESQDRAYTEAYNEFVSDHEDDWDSGDWLNAVDYDHMTDIANNFDISWPYWTEYQGDDDNMDVANVADDFSSAIGRPVNHSTNYHGAQRAEGTYVVEPDGSLEGDDSSDGGLEFVSPPLPIAELLSDLQKVKRWAKRRGCYTGSDYGTGLHINVSVDGWKGIENLDYVKLAILLGDEYVLKQFERQSNNYCKSAMSLVKTAIKQNPLSAKELLEKMKNHMNTAASKLIHSGITTKFTSINTKDGYVEFRSPGGDWLDEFEDKIEPTLLRFVVALDAAVHEDKYKQEYQKKLYKLLEPSMDEYGAMVKDFSDYVSGVGGAPEQVVKDFRRAALSKLQQSNATKKSQRNEGNWGLWAKVPNRFAALTTDKDSALRRFKSKEDGEAWMASHGLKPERFDVLEIPADYKPAEKAPANQDLGNYIGIRSAVDRDQFKRGPDGEVLRFPSIDQAYGYMSRNNLDRSEWRISDLNMVDDNLLGAQAATFQEPNANRGDLLPRGPGPWEIYRISDGSSVRALDQTNRNGAETEARTALGLRAEAPELYGVRTRQSAQQPNWETVNDRTGQVVHRFYADNQNNAIAAQYDYLTSRGLHSDDFTLQAIEQPSTAQVAQQSHNAHQAANMQEWTILNGQGAVMGRVQAATQGEANQRAAGYLGRFHPSMIGQEVEVVPTSAHTARQQSQTQPQRFEIYKRSTGQSAVELSSTDQQSAWLEAQEMFRTRYAAYDPAEYSVRAVTLSIP